MDATVDPLTVRACEIYDTKLRAVLEPDHVGEFVCIDVPTGDYFLGRTAIVALQARQARHPGPDGFLFRIGYTAAYRVGGRIAH